MGIIDFSPLDSEGIRRERPASEVKWQKLTNCAFRDGAIVPRPGFKEFANLNDIDLPSGIEPSPIIALSQIENPGSSATGRESWTIATETLRPDGSSDGSPSGWTNDHTAIDETPPGFDTMFTSTEGAQKRITFANPSTTYETVMGVMVYGQARNTQTGGQSNLKFYQRRGGTDYEAETVTIYTDEDLETNLFQNFSFIIPYDLSDGFCWLDADLDSLELTVEFESGTQSTTEFVPPSGDGDDTDFTDATNGGTATFSDYSLDTVVYNKETTDRNGARTTAVGDKQGFTVSAFTTTYSSIDSITLAMWVEVQPNTTHAFKMIYKDSGGTEYDLTASGESTPTITYAGRMQTKFRQFLFNYPLNPADSAAWEEADITGGQFIIENISGTSQTWRSMTPIVFGQVSGQTVHINTLAIDVMGMTGGLPGSGLRATRLFTSNRATLRVDDDAGASPTITDVTNSATLSSSPANVPADQATLYGQVYMVNGVDPTVRYPNGSDLCEALSTNDSAGANPITGRTVAAFADRILYGWVKENTTVTPERVAYSKIFDGGTHADAAGTASDFDLLDTPGGVVNLTPLNEDVCFAGKEEGIYALRRSGRDVAPIFRDVIDFSTRCMSITGVQRILNNSGQPIVLFLGWNPAAGYNVFAFDGAQVVAVGDPISRALREDANHQLLRFAFTGVDPQNGDFWLAFAEGDEVKVNSGYIFHMRTGAWSRAELAFDINSLGNWVVPDTTRTHPSCGIIWGEPKLIAGTFVPMVGDREFIVDSIGTPTHEAASVGSNGDVDRYSNDAGGEIGRFSSPIQATIETGDVDLFVDGQDPNIVGYRWRIEYEALGPFRVRVDASEDGGKDWNAVAEYTLGGSIAQRNETVADILDITNVNAARARFRFRIGAESLNLGEQPWKINKLKLEMIPGGEAVG